MLALLTAPRRFLARVLEKVEPGLPGTVHRSLARYVEETLPEAASAGFSDFDWQDNRVLGRPAGGARDRNDRHAGHVARLVALGEAPMNYMFLNLLWTAGWVALIVVVIPFLLRALRRGA